VVGPHAVAFGYDNELYLGSLRGAERPVAHAEAPLVFTNGGLYTYRARGQELLLRSDNGAVLKVIARWRRDYNYANGSLYFVSGPALMAARGARVRRLASLRRLGLSADPSLQPVGPLIELSDDHRLVVLRPDGPALAWAPLRDWHGQSISSFLAPASHDRAVAFTATSGQVGANGISGPETVYVLRAGTHEAVPVYREQVDFAPCERWVSLKWHGSWLLYKNTEGNLVAIDTTGAHRAIDLTSLVRRIPGMRDGFAANWTGQPTG
jgi:hypothetical protein